MAVLIYNNKKNSNTTISYQSWLHDIVKKGKAINFNAKPLAGNPVVWVETKVFGRWIKYEITEQDLANKLIHSNPTDFRIKPINMELQLQRDYKTSRLCKRFRLIAFILFHIRQKPIVRLTKQSAYNTAILIASLAMIMIMIITIIMTIE